MTVDRKMKVGLSMSVCLGWNKKKARKRMLAKECKVPAQKLNSISSSRIVWNKSCNVCGYF